MKNKSKYFKFLLYMHKTRNSKWNLRSKWTSKSPLIIGKGRLVECFRSKSQIKISIGIHNQWIERVYQHELSDIKFISMDKKWILDISLNKISSPWTQHRMSSRIWLIPGSLCFRLIDKFKCFLRTAKYSNPYAFYHIPTNPFTNQFHLYIPTSSGRKAQEWFIDASSFHFREIHQLVEMVDKSSNDTVSNESDRIRIQSRKRRKITDSTTGFGWFHNPKSRIWCRCVRLSVRIDLRKR